MHECLSECRSKLKILESSLLCIENRAGACSVRTKFSWCYVKYYKTLFFSPPSFFGLKTGNIFHANGINLLENLAIVELECKRLQLIGHRRKKTMADDVVVHFHILSLSLFSEHSERRMKSEQGQFHTDLTASQEILIT